jgi:membrane dipeptidase
MQSHSTVRSASEGAASKFLVWDMTTPFDWHGLSDAARDSILPRLAAGGYNCASISLIGDHHSLEQTIGLIARTRAFIREHSDDFALVHNTNDIRECFASGKLAVVFQFQGSEALNRDVKMVELYYQLGVRLMLMAYNQKNSIGDGCMERHDGGLSRYGESVVREMNRVGMLVDVSHTGYRTAMDVLGVSSSPVILSHSNALALADNPRNVPDEIIRAVAASGGVMGIVGYSRFLTPENDSSTAQILRHINYVADLVGSSHVGLGLDWVVDTDSLMTLNLARPDVWPGQATENTDSFAAPEQVHEIAEQLLKSGWTDGDVAGVLGENWVRVADQVWR